MRPATNALAPKYVTSGSRREFMQHLKACFLKWTPYNHIGHWQMTQIIAQSKVCPISPYRLVSPLVSPFLVPRLRLPHPSSLLDRSKHTLFWVWTTIVFMQVPLMGMAFGTLDYFAVYTPDPPVAAQVLTHQGANAHILGLVFVTRRHAYFTLDGKESTAESPIIVEEEYFFTADQHKGMKAEWPMTQFGVNHVIQHHKDRGIRLDDGFFLASDGCGVQMKSRKPFLGMTLLQESLQVPMFWSYGGSGRFKWKHDGAGGAFKRAATTENFLRTDKENSRVPMYTKGEIPSVVYHLMR